MLFMQSYLAMLNPIRLDPNRYKWMYALTIVQGEKS